MPESSLDSGAACPPSPVQIFPGDVDSSLSAQNREQELAGDEAGDKEDAEGEGEASAAEELPQSEGERSAAGPDMPGSPGQPRATSPAVEGAGADQLASLAATADTESCAEKVLDEEREEAAADSKSEDCLDDGKVRDLPVWFWCWLFLSSRQALTQESSWSPVCDAGPSAFLVRRAVIPGGGMSALNSQMGIFRTELGNHSLLHTPNAAQSHRQAKPSTAPRVLSLGGGTVSASSAAVCPGRTGLIMKLMPSPAVRAALFLSFCCFSQLAQSWGRRVRSCLAPRSQLCVGCEVGVGKDGASGLLQELRAQNLPVLPLWEENWPHYRSRGLG